VEKNLKRRIWTSPIQSPHRGTLWGLWPAVLCVFSIRSNSQKLGFCTVQKPPKATLELQPSQSPPGACGPLSNPASSPRMTVCRHPRGARGGRGGARPGAHPGVRNFSPLFFCFFYQGVNEYERRQYVPSSSRRRSVLAPPLLVDSLLKFWVIFDRSRTRSPPPPAGPPPPTR